MHRAAPTWLFLIVGLLAASLAGCPAANRNPGCTTSEDCGTDQLCVDGECVDMGNCTSDADCQAPLDRCRTATGECVQCLGDDDCTRAEHCVAYTCREGCASDADCGEPTPFCDLATEVCAECLSDGHCADGEVCNEGACGPPPTCEQDDDCARGEICEDGACHAGCRSSRDCPQGTECLPEEGPYGTCAQCQADGDLDKLCPPHYCRVFGHFNDRCKFIMNRIKYLLIFLQHGFQIVCGKRGRGRTEQCEHDQRDFFHFILYYG